MHVPRIRRRQLMAGGCLALAGALLLSTAGVATAATTDPNPSPREIAHAALSRQAATQGMVLFENDGALPMPGSGNVAVFGVGAYATIKGGTGSGDVNSRYTVTVRQGLEAAGYAVTTGDAYWNAMMAAFAAQPATNPARYALGEAPLTPATAAPTAPTKTALYVVARNTGEGGDRTATPGDYYLTETELGNLRLLGQTYRKVIVVLNVGAVLDTSFFEEINDQVPHIRGAKHQRSGKPLDALLLMSQPGQEAGHALVDVLTGAVTPSGKTVDTWASSYDYYAASSNNDGS